MTKALCLICDGEATVSEYAGRPDVAAWALRNFKICKAHEKELGSMTNGSKPSEIRLEGETAMEDQSRAVAVQEEKSPQEMIRFAVERGADLEKLEKLLALQERWEANEARKAYNQAMTAFKANPPKIEKDKKVGYDSKQGGKVGYSHATLGNVTEKISGELSKHGLSASWKTKQEGSNIYVTCTIKHVMGHSEETTLCAAADATGSKNPIQAIGSTVTYLERYTLLALTGLATYDQDDDGAAAATEFIDDKQLNQLLDLIADKEVDIPRFLKFMEVESLEKMPKAKYQKAVSALEAKKKK